MPPTHPASDNTPPIPPEPPADWAYDHRDTALGLAVAEPQAAPPTPELTWGASVDGLDYPMLEDTDWARPRTTTVFAPQDNGLDWHYNHHVYVRGHAGVLYLMHSQATCAEDAAGNRVLLWTSRDRGDSWAGPYVLAANLDLAGGVDEPDPERPGRVVYPGQWLALDGRFYALMVVDDCGRRRRDGRSRPRLGRGYLAREVGPDGARDEPFWIHEHVPPYRDDADLLDPPYRADPGQALLELLRQPGSFPPYGSVPMPGNQPWCNAAVFGPDIRLINPTTYRLPDGRWLRLYRNVARRTAHGMHDTRVYARCSWDGSTWSEPVRTPIPTSPMFHDGQWLSNGLLAYIGNPCRPQRDPLMIAFSRDGLNFPAHAAFAVRRDVPTKPRITGHGKGGGAQQASFAEVAGRLIVAYSIAKEDVVVTTLDLPPTL